MVRENSSINFNSHYKDYNDEIDEVYENNIENHYEKCKSIVKNVRECKRVDVRGSVPHSPTSLHSYSIHYFTPCNNSSTSIYYHYINVFNTYNYTYNTIKDINTSDIQELTTYTNYYHY